MTITQASIKKNSHITTVLLIPLIIVQTSCKKWIEVPPPTASLAENNVYSGDATAIAVLTGIYHAMNNPTLPFQGKQSITIYTGLSSDELTLHSGVEHVVYLGYFKNQLSVAVAPVAGGEHWLQFYPLIYKCNAAIEGLNASSTLTPSVKQQLLGEAKLMRAFFYFYLVNLFGDVPLSLSTDPQINTKLARTPQAQVYQQIIADLEEAKELLSPDYLNETLLKKSIDRVRPTKWAAAALLARIYLYTGDYIKAEANATMVINNTNLYSLPTLNMVFLKNSREAIWQIQPTAADFNTEEAQTLIIPSTGPSVGSDVTNPVYLSDFLLDGFEVGDERAIYGNWIDTTIYQTTSIDYDTIVHPFKYKINASPGVTSPSDLQEYFMVLRLGEQYLIRAEARAEQNNINGAQEDLNMVRIRAGLGSTLASDKASLLEAILHERQVELFTELGHRWFDLKRTKNVDAVMSVVTPQKSNGAPWQSYQQWYPLPFEELAAAPNLVQNPGY